MTAHVDVIWPEKHLLLRLLQSAIVRPILLTLFEIYGEKRGLFRPFSTAFLCISPRHSSPPVIQYILFFDRTTAPHKIYLLLTPPPYFLLLLPIFFVWSRECTKTNTYRSSCPHIFSSPSPAVSFPKKFFSFIFLCTFSPRKCGGNGIGNRWRMWKKHVCTGRQHRYTVLGGRNIMMPILGGGGKGDDDDDHPFPVQQKYEWPEERGKIKFFSSTRGV